MQTRSGRSIRAPVNEYTSRQYIPGSRFVGADHYDRQYSVNSTIPTADQEEEEENEYDFYDDFLENDYETDSQDSDYVPSEPTEDEDYDSESEDEDDSDYLPSEPSEDEEYDSESDESEYDRWATDFIKSCSNCVCESSRNEQESEDDGYNTPPPIPRHSSVRNPPPIQRRNPPPIQRPIPPPTHPWRDDFSDSDDESDEEHDVNININLIVDSETESDSESDVESGSESDVESDSDTDSESDSDSDEEQNVTINVTFNIGTINFN